MPFRSQAQRAWMYRNDPAMAKRWEKETPKGKLPTRIGHQTNYKKLATKLKTKTSEPGALLRAAQGFKRSTLKQKDSFGETDLDKRTMKVNKKLARSQTDYGGKPKPGHDGVLDVIVHESLHAAHPKMTEKAVRKKTKVLKKKLSPGQKKKFYALFKKKK